VAWSGSGAVVPLKHLSETRLRQAIDRVLSEPSHRDNALKLQRSIQQAGGVQRAADIVEQAIATGRPVLREPLAARL
jgi:UDP:flavonoid glycosyltransferase YjiC (YdhE family)